MTSYLSDLSGRRLASAAAFALALAAALAAVSVAGGAEALSSDDEFTVDDIKYRVTDEYDQYVEIIGRENDPVRVGGTVSCDGAEWTVTSVREWVFAGCASLREVSLPEATSVGGCAFFGCGSLEEVSLPSAVSVGGSAFWNCISLAFVRFSESLESVGMDAFSVSFHSEDGELDRDADSLRGRVFIGTGDGKLYVGFTHGSVRYIVLPGNEVSAVGFEGSPAALSVPPSVEHGGSEYVPVSIGDGAFAGCGSAESVSIGDSVASIGKKALGCPGLRSIEVSSGNTAFESEAGVLYDHGKKTLLRFPASKQRLVIPDTVEEIADYAFMGAGAALKEQYSEGDPITYFRYAAIPASVVRIGDLAFAGSTLECLKFAGGAVSVGYSAFDGCSALNYVVFGAELTEVGAYAFNSCRFFDGNTEMSLSDAVAGHKFTGDDASSLKLYVPEAGGTIVSGDVKYRITDSGADSKIVAAVRPTSEDAEELSIPASIRYLGFDWEVASVGSKAFSGLQSLRSVSFGGPISVGLYAFFGCKGLESVHFGGVAELGTSAFSCCRSLAEINLGSVASVGKHAFYGCGSLTCADLSNAESIGYGAFTGTDLQEVTFSPALSHADPKAFYGYAFKDAAGAKIKIAPGNLAGKSFSGQGKVLAEAV